MATQEPITGGTSSSSSSKSLLIIILIVLVLVLAAAAVFLLGGGTILGGGSKIADTKKTVPMLDELVLRPEDMDIDYHIESGATSPYGSSQLIGERGEAEAKRFIAATGRVDGWKLEMRRTKKADVAPTVITSTVELFETSDGAKLALSSDWHYAYQSNDREIVFLDENCDLGDKCIYYMFEKYDPATQLTTLRYEVAFTYRNFLAQVSAIGLDFDITENDAIELGQIILDKLEGLELVSAK
jgi:hypothetical protein